MKNKICPRVKSLGYILHMQCILTNEPGAWESHSDFRAPIESFFDSSVFPVSPNLSFLCPPSELLNSSERV